MILLGLTVASLNADAGVVKGIPLADIARAYSIEYAPPSLPAHRPRHRMEQLEYACRDPTSLTARAFGQNVEDIYSRCSLLRRVEPLLALFGHGAMSD